MSWCGSSPAGICGIARLYSEKNGDVSSDLNGLPELKWNDYWRPPLTLGNNVCSPQLGNQEAIFNLLVGKHVAVRDETIAERETLCKVMSLVEKGDIHFCQSKGHDNRCTTTFMGHTETKLGRGYDRDLTPFGTAAVQELKSSLMETNTGCSQKPTMYPLNWDGVEQHKSSTKSIFIWEHTDKKHHDINLDGSLGEITIRSGLCYGQPSILRLSMKLVSAEPTGEVLKNGKQKYRTLEQKIGHCDILLCGPMSWYIMDEIGSGRHYGWSMKDKVSGKKKFVVIFHSTHRPSESDPSPITTRGVLLLDRTFDSYQVSRNYVDSAIRGNTPLLDFGNSISLPPFIDDRVKLAEWINGILQKTVVYVPPKSEKDDQKVVDILMSDSEYFEDLCSLTNASLYNSFIGKNISSFPTLCMISHNRWLGIKSLLLSALEEKVLEEGISEYEFAGFPIAKSSRKGNKVLNQLAAIVRSIISLDTSGELEVSLHPEGNAGERWMRFVEAFDLIDNNCESLLSKIEMLDAIKDIDRMPSGYRDKDIVRLSKAVVAELKLLIDPHHLETQSIVEDVVKNTWADLNDTSNRPAGHTSAKKNTSKKKSAPKKKMLASKPTKSGSDKPKKSAPKKQKAAKNSDAAVPRKCSAPNHGEEESPGNSKPSPIKKRKSIIIRVDKKKEQKDVNDTRPAKRQKKMNDDKPTKQCSSCGGLKKKHSFAVKEWNKDGECNVCTKNKAKLAANQEKAAGQASLPSKSTDDKPTKLCARPKKTVIPPPPGRVIPAPPGKLGLTLMDKTDLPEGMYGGTYISHVHTHSVLAQQVSIGDSIISIDGKDVSQHNVVEISSILSYKASNPVRVLVVGDC